VEQRAEETARLSRIAAGDAGPPAGDNGQADGAPAADQDAGEANGHSPEEPASWTAGHHVAGGSAATEPDFPAPEPADYPPAGAADYRARGATSGATGAYPSVSAYPPATPASATSPDLTGTSGSPGAPGEPATSAGGAYTSADVGYPQAGGGYSSAGAEGAYAGPGVDDGYGPPGTERDYTAPPAREYPAPSAPEREFPAPPADSIYGSSGTQPDYSAAPYPSQVSSPAPDPQPERTSRATTGWQAATARIPRPQAVPRRPQREGSAARQAHLTVARFEPWSVMKFSFMVSLVCFVILFVAVALLYGTLAGLGVFDAIQKALSNVTSGQGTSGVNLSHWFSASTILTYTALLGILDVVLITAFATVGSVIYNLTAHLVGGVEVTLKETE
jgi:hypothetical protein